MAWALRISGAGLELAGFVFLGWLIDRAWGTNPWLTVAGTVVGMVASFVHLMTLAKIAAKSQSAKTRVVRRPMSKDNLAFPESENEDEGSNSK